MRRGRVIMGFEVFAAVTMKITVFWAVTLCGLIGVYELLVGIFYFHLAASFER
jgi:hypothetical protein